MTNVAGHRTRAAGARGSGTTAHGGDGVVARAILHHAADLDADAAAIAAVAELAEERAVIDAAVAGEDEGRPAILNARP